MNPAWLSPDEQRTWRAFIRVKALVQQSLNQQLLNDAGISDSEYGVLVLLSETDGHSLRIFELATALQWEKSRLSHLLKRMEKRGLLVRQRCDSDRRGQTITLTPEGLDLIRSAAPRHVTQVRTSFFDALTAEQTFELGEALEAIIAHHDGLERDELAGPSSAEASDQRPGN